MVSRPYVSPVRAAAAQAKRAQVLEAAAGLLRSDPLSAFSLDAVAKAAGVTRLTIYHQFGSRRGLLEAVLDILAAQGRLDRISDALASPDPRASLDQLVEIFCKFWSGDPAVGRLQDAMATDPEFGQAVQERNERRRHVVAGLVRRFAAKGASQANRRDAVDLIFALTSYPVFKTLAAGRSAKATCALIKAACRDALRRVEGSA
jgi:AcrR family transcriptional regulator